jgi:hypothetical protein
MAVSPGYPRRMPFIASIIAGFSSKHGASRASKNNAVTCFDLFYQVQIRLGSPRSSRLVVFCSQITTIAPPRPLTRRPARRFPEVQ